MDIGEAREKVFEKRPVFRAMYEKYENQKWDAYMRESYTPPSDNSPLSPSLLLSVSEIVKATLGEKEVAEVLESLKKTKRVDTADHHGILCHPFFWNVDAAKAKPEEEVPYDIIFSVGNVSPTNSSFPRSIFFHDQNLSLKKLNYIPWRSRRSALYSLPPSLGENIAQMKREVADTPLNQIAKKKLADFLSALEKDSRIQNAERLSDELTIATSVLWDNVFDGARKKICYIEAEEVVRRIILSPLGAPKTKKIIFEENYRTLFEKHFEGKIGAWSTKEQKGTFLFWYAGKSEGRVPLSLKDNFLENAKANIKIEITPEKLLPLIENRSLIPSMALCYSLLSFEEGLTLTGGFSQIQYLGDMKDAWLQIFPEDKERLSKIRTDIFSGEMSFVGITNGKETKNATLLDMLIYSKEEKRASKVFQDALEGTSIGEALNAMMYEFLEMTLGKYEELTGIKELKTKLDVR